MGRRKFTESKMMRHLQDKMQKIHDSSNSIKHKQERTTLAELSFIITGLQAIEQSKEGNP